MLDVTFFRDSRNRLSCIFADGHADWAEHGSDIVCAAVSAILQAARLGLEAHARVSLDAYQEGGLMRLRWPEAVRDDTSVVAIVTTAELATAEIAERYPQHVAIHRSVES